VEKCSAAREATDDNIIWCMRFECKISKATCTHTQKYVIVIAFHGETGFVDAPQCYVIRKLAVLFMLKLMVH
jgi:hypothetical protein